jgi:hypothetical protein
MYVTYREEEPYYTKKGDLDQFLEDPVNGGDRREGEDNGGEGSDVASGAIGEVIVGGMVPQDMEEVITKERSSNDERSDPSSQEEMGDDDVVVVGTISCPTGEKTNEKQGEQPIVYYRRRAKKQGEQPPQPEQVETPVPYPSSYSSPSSSPAPAGNVSPTLEHVELPLAQRRAPRVNAGTPPPHSLWL